MSDRGHAGGVALLRRMRFAVQRFIASARAGTYSGLRRAARFAARAVDQDGTLLLMPREPSFTFYYVPLLILAAAAGTSLAAFG